MRCVLVSEFGGPSVLKIAQHVKVPIPGDKQMLVNVKYAGVNPVDTYIRSGAYASKPQLPYTPGKDGSGVVHDVGDGVTKFKKGDKIWFYGGVSGACAEFCVVKENYAAKLQPHLSFKDGAMLGTPYLTASRAILKASVQKGMTVMVHGATGGVGTAAIQILASMGVKVIGTAGSSPGVDLIKNMGVEKVYNHHEKDYMQAIKANEDRIDVILEMLANVNLAEDLKLIGAGGTIVIIGSRGPLEINPRDIMVSECNVTGVMLMKSTEAEIEEQFTIVERAIEAGTVKPKHWKTFELEDVCDAHKEIIENSGTLGQFVLKVTSEDE